MARFFDGVNEAINFGDKAEFLITGDLFWACWLRMFSTSSLLDVFANVEGGAGETEAENSMLFLQTQGVSNSWDIEYIHEYDAGQNESNTFLTNILNDIWTHIVVERDVSANTVIIYKDLSPVSTFNYTNDPTSGAATTNKYFLGTRSNAASAAELDMAEVVLGDTLGANLRRAHFFRGARAFQGIAANAAPLRGDHSPEIDISGNNNTGALVNTPAKVDHAPISVFAGMSFIEEVAAAGGATIPIFEHHYRSMRA